jgi:hypothetical protein
MEPTEQYEALGIVWERLTPRVRGAIMVMAGVVKAPTDRRIILRTRRGETPQWLPTALTILKDARADISDRALAKRLGVATSTLTRNPMYLRAKKTYMIEIYKPVTRFGRSGKSKRRKA